MPWGECSVEDLARVMENPDKPRGTKLTQIALFEPSSAAEDGAGLTQPVHTMLTLHCRVGEELRRLSELGSYARRSGCVVMRSKIEAWPRETAPFNVLYHEVHFSSAFPEISPVPAGPVNLRGESRRRVDKGPYPAAVAAASIHFAAPELHGAVVGASESLLNPKAGGFFTVRLATCELAERAVAEIMGWGGTDACWHEVVMLDDNPSMDSWWVPVHGQVAAR